MSGIRVLADNDAGRILRAIVTWPGELDVAALVTMLFPCPDPLPELPPLQWSPVQASARYRAWRQSIQGRDLVRRQHQRIASDRVTRLLGRLQSQGLIQKCIWVTCSDWWDSLRRGGSLEACLARVAAVDVLPQDEEDEDPEERPVFGRHALDLVGRAEECGSLTYAALMGNSPSGARKLAYDKLVEAGVLVPPSFRLPTEAGQLLVRSWDAV